MNTIIIVAAHKAYRMPDDPVYLPVFVGATGRETPDATWQRDDEGESISRKNPTFCELTGHYWLWKNAQAEVYGLCHYRRYFGRRLGQKHDRILSGDQINLLMANCDVLLPPKRHYWIETNRSQYAHAHHAEDLALTRQILSESHPDYLSAWDLEMNRRSGHRFNMFIMRKEPFHAYSAWLFDILFELEKRLDISAYSPKDRRVFGYMSERLLDVWLSQQVLRLRECPVVYMESQQWPYKVMAFLKRKFIHNSSQFI